MNCSNSQQLNLVLVAGSCLIWNLFTSWKVFLHVRFYTIVQSCTLCGLKGPKGNCGTPAPINPMDLRLVLAHAISLEHKSEEQGQAVKLS